MNGTTAKVLAGDPVKAAIKKLATEAIEVKGNLLHDARNEFVRNAVATDILDRAGYKGEDKVKTKVSVEVTEAMASRFERVLGMNNNPTPTITRVKIEETGADA